MGMDFFFFFLRPGADVPRLSRFLLNSESVTFVTQSIKMISQGSQIAAYTLRDCHRKFHRGLCKCSKRGIKCQLSSWGSMGGGWGRGGRCKAPPPSSKPPLSDTGGKPKCLFTPRWQSLRVNFPPHLSCLPSTGVSFDRLKIREGSKLGKEQVSFLLSSPTNG